MPTGLADTRGLALARQNLTEARIHLQAKQDDEKIARAYAERDAISALNGSAGKNDEERRRNLLLALENDKAYQRTLHELRKAEAAVSRAETELELAQDQRRAEEWGIRLQLVIALDRAGVTSDAPGDDVSFDDTADEEVMSNLNQYRERKAAHAEQINRNRAYREMDEVFGVSF